MRAAVALLFLALTCFAGAAAQDPRLGPDHWMRQRVEPSIRPGATLQQVKERVRDYFYNLDFDGTGVSARSYDIFLQQHRAKERATQINRLLALDLDGDGVITREEMETVARIYAASTAARLPADPRPDQERRRAGMATQIAHWLKYDRNGDGRITIDEVLAAAEDELDAREKADGRPREARRAHLVAELVPLALDANGDGIVSLDEYDAAVEAAFREYDDDGDGVISAAEAQAHKHHADKMRKAALQAIDQQKKDTALRERLTGCALPSVPADAKLVLFGTDSGAAVSNVSLGGDDDVIEVADVVVEPGAEPLALVLTSRAAMIWRIRGASDRLVRVIVAANKGVQPGGPARGGVIGVARDKVSFAGRTDCVPAFSRPDDEDGAAAALAAVLGRPADVAHSAGRTGTVRLPSGANDLETRLQPAVDPPRRDPAAELYDAVRHEFPSSVVAINPDDVVSAAAAARYPVLPLEAGIAQLLDEGAISISRYYRLGQPGRPETSRRLAGEIRVKRNIRIPAGLDIERMFVLEAGVPMPEANVGKHCIRSSDGQVLANQSSCR
jgi:Ca2+-binding EF-hand superfamily protein